MRQIKTSGRQAAKGSHADSSFTGACACCQALASVRMPSLSGNAGNGDTDTTSGEERKNPFLNLLGISLRADAGHKRQKDAVRDPGDIVAIPQGRHIWQGFEGLVITLFGICLPALLIVASAYNIPKRLSLVFLNHPLETACEFFLITLIPVVNYLIWSLFCRERRAFSRKLIVGLGTAIGSAFVIAGVSFAAIFAGAQASDNGTDFASGFFWLAAIALSQGATSIYLGAKIRQSRELAESRQLVVIYLVIGAALSFLTFTCAEARPWCIRLAETEALQGHKEAMKWLKFFNPERELLMECSDSKAAGLAGFFLPIKSTRQQALYFAVTGKPFSFSDIHTTDLSSLPDDFLSRNVVGDKIPGLEMARSTVSGNVHAQTLSSTIQWTFVFKNSSSSQQEARAELALPAGAVVTGLRLWDKGEAEDCEFANKDKTGSVSQSDTKAVVTDLGHNRALFTCSPVAQDQELKVRVSIVVPLKPDSPGLASFVLPGFMSTNFALADENVLKLKSDQNLALHSQKMQFRESLNNTLTAGDIQGSHMLIYVEREQSSTPVIVYDKLATDQKQAEEDKRRQDEESQQAAKNANTSQQITITLDGSKDVKHQIADIRKAFDESASKKSTEPAKVQPLYLVQSVAPVAAPVPKHLLVVVDGSKSLNPHKDDLIYALSKLPKDIPVSVIIASNADAGFERPLSLADALSKLRTYQFEGGQDNLKYVVQAAGLAGESQGGAVLWIHGPQPVINDEIYIVPQYIATPSFYELSIGDDTDTYALFNNHREIGPFKLVPKSETKISADLIAFFARWQPNTTTLAVKLYETDKPPAETIHASAGSAQELLALYASQETAKLVRARESEEATVFARSYGIVSSVTDAIVTPAGHVAPRDEAANSEGAYAEGSISEGAESYGAAEPVAPAGTTIPSDTIVGVNTSGLVRVNNLANLEALLNILANSGELGFIAFGLFLSIRGFASANGISIGKDFELGKNHAIAIGAALILVGLGIPGFINFLVASARDANLFT